ncbi:tyrosinase [Trametes polyzona]|nr:tyrosinase [Trametes polyzona]
MVRISVVTTGGLGGETAGAVAPNRLEVNEFIKDEKMFSLYIQALQAMMDAPRDDPQSFYQIAGIHGLPYAPWNEVGESALGELAGYCTHGSVLFPTWHRAYVSLYEKHAIQIAQQYVFEGSPTTDWDWARAAVPPPELISMERISIITSDGRRTLVKNPLLRYRFEPIEPSFSPPFSNWQTTLRHPTREDSQAKDDVEGLISTLQANQADFTSKLYCLLTRTKTWSAFSSHTPGNGGSTSSSLEAIHDAIHDCVGGMGHMGDTAYGGFDPIFMFHHCQVDRLLSLWSALNPGVGVSESSSDGGTFTIPSQSIVNENTDLTPFRSTEHTFWTSRETVVPCPSQLGYSYPEFNGLDLNDIAAVAHHIAGVVNSLYAPQRLRHYLLPRVAKSSKRLTVDWEEVPLARSVALDDSEDLDEAYAVVEVPVVDADDVIAGYLALFPKPPSIQSRRSQSRHMWEWSVRVRVKKYEVGRGFAVLVFLGRVPDDPRDWYAAPTYVGAHHAFVNSAQQRCVSCRRRAGALIEGFVHLNDALAKHAAFHSMEPEIVKPYLRRKLSWRVRKIDGSAIPPEHLASLEVVVAAQPLSFPQSEQLFFAQGTPIYYPELTGDHTGGSLGAS